MKKAATNTNPNQTNKTVKKPHKKTTTGKSKTLNKMSIKVKIEGQSEEELLNYIHEFFKGADTGEEFDKRMNLFEDKHTPKKEILQECKEVFYSVLDSYLQDEITKEKALLLLQSKRLQMSETIKKLAANGYFVEIDYNDGHGYIPEEFMKITGDIFYYYGITQNNIVAADVKLENFSSPSVKRVVKSISDTFDKLYEVGKTNTDTTNSTKETKQKTTEIKNIIPPVIQDVFNEGLLCDIPVDGKYIKRAGKKDKDIIKWIIDYSGYADSLTADLYMRYIQASVAPQSIGQYISRSNTEAKIPARK